MSEEQLRAARELPKYHAEAQTDPDMLKQYIKSSGYRHRSRPGTGINRTSFGGVSDDDNVYDLPMKPEDCKSCSTDPMIQTFHEMAKEMSRQESMLNTRATQMRPVVATLTVGVQCHMLDNE